MALDYRKPGVYVEESLLLGSPDLASATSIALFVGAAGTGPTSYPVLCQSWSDYVLNFGSFSPITDPDGDVFTTYLPYAVYSYFQNGGQPAYVQRAIGSTTGDTSSYTVRDDNTTTATIASTGFVAGTGPQTGTGVATVNTVADHGFTTGDVVSTVAGTKTYINAVAPITVTDSDTYTYTAPSGHADAASGADSGTATALGDPAFTLTANSVGSSGNVLGVKLETVDAANGVFNMSIYSNTTEVERFQYLTMTGDVLGTRKLEVAINDPYSGSTLVRASAVDVTKTPDDINSIAPLSGGSDPGLPDATQDYTAAAQAAVGVIESPILVNLVGYTSNTNDPDAFEIPAAVGADTFNRGDVFIVNDGAKPRAYGQSPSQYKTGLTSTLGQRAGDSYVASFTPWIIVPDPMHGGATITIPPGGAVAGVISRVDSTIGVFRAPAGVVAQISNAVGVDTKYSDTDLGDLNTSNINAVRPVQGQGVAVMGARTRKLYGADRYISGRRTLIYLKESLRRSTQFGLFENNDQRLWSQLIMTAERLLRPLWESGGLRGNNASEAYYIKCDETINTPALIQSGEVRMEVGVALEYPAEFIVIRVTQFEGGGIASEVIQPVGPASA